jgi:hypothetical protein
VSALQKAIRRSQPEPAVYWGFELWKSGYDNWAWSRMREIASEDIGIADRTLPANLAALEETSRLENKKKGGSAGALQFVQAVLLLATAEKSRLVALMAIVNDSDHAPRLEIPDEALDKHTRRGRALGRGFDHFINEAAKLEDPPSESEINRLEGSFRRCRIAIGEKAPDLPSNPWKANGKDDAPVDSWLPDEEPKGDVQEEMPI